jgi:xanthine dehydrogenase accessory factor
MNFDREELTKAIAQHGRVARIVVVSVNGSTPRDVGASMLVWDGGQSGTIGGGTLEFEAANAALEGPYVKTFPLGPALGQCCGGSVTIANEIFTEPPTEMKLFTRKINGLKDKPLSISRQESSARRVNPLHVIYENGWLSEPIEPAKAPLWIFGSGHVGRAFIHTLEPLPHFEITWVDTAPARFPDTIPGSVTPLIATNPALTVKHAPADTYHLILTYSHALDLELCHQILSHDFAFAGLIGSKTKWARFRSRLAALGHSKTQISRIACPIGDPALGKHPQEIAVGVATSLLSRRCRMTLKKDHAI